MKKLFVIAKIYYKEVTTLYRSRRGDLFFGHYAEMQMKFNTEKEAEDFIEKEKLYLLQTITILPIYE